MRLQANRLPKAIRAITLGTFLATAALGITACGEDENEVGEEIEEAGEEVKDAAEDAAD